MVAQYSAGGQRQAWYTQSLARIDEVLNVANDSGKFWYQADALGSVYGLTNQAGALIGGQSYDVFGAPTPAPAGPAGQPFGFTGREHELDSGLVYARDRYLSTISGRWTQPDRLGMDEGPNFYGYVGANPTAFTDPFGRFIWQAYVKQVGQAAGLTLIVSGLTMLVQACQTYADDDATRGLALDLAAYAAGMIVMGVSLLAFFGPDYRMGAHASERMLERGFSEATVQRVIARGARYWDPKNKVISFVLREEGKNLLVSVNPFTSKLTTVIKMSGEIAKRLIPL